LDIACGSIPARLRPAYINTPFGEKRSDAPAKDFTAQFEPWFCRILLELDANPVGIDFGDLDRDFLHIIEPTLGDRCVGLPA